MFKGKSYKTYQRGKINQSIGMFFQDFALFHASLRENVGYGDLKNIENREKITEALRKGGGMKLLERLPEGMETWLLKKVKKGSVNLSGGEQQKVAVSRAHMSDKDVLIFDEPASHWIRLRRWNSFCHSGKNSRKNSNIDQPQKLDCTIGRSDFVMDQGNWQK